MVTTRSSNARNKANGSNKAGKLKNESQDKQVGKHDNNMPQAKQTEKPETLENGIVYFLLRPRVNTPHPHDSSEIARTYLLLRPMSPTSRLGHGPINDAGASRLLVLPKKVLPRSGRDRFMAFVEKAHTSFEEVKRTFLMGEERETKTRGTSVVPAAVPAAEGIYVISRTPGGRECHFTYIITIPDTMGEVQTEMGVKERGAL